MTHTRRLLFLGLVLVGSQLSTGCYLGYTNRPVLFPNVAITPVRPYGTGCGPAGCYREFGPGECGGALFPGRLAGVGGPAVAGPVYDAPVGYNPAGCTDCGGGIPLAAGYGGAPIAVSPNVPQPGVPVYPPGEVPVYPHGSVPMQMPGGTSYGVPYDSGIVPTLKPPAGSVPLQMPTEVKKVSATK